MTENTYTTITRYMYVCNDCGAYADSPSQVDHHEGCDPGSSEYLEGHFNQITREHYGIEGKADDGS